MKRHRCVSPAETPEHHCAGQQALHRFLQWEAAERARVQGAVRRNAEGSVGVDRVGWGAPPRGASPAGGNRRQRQSRRSAAWVARLERHRLHKHLRSGRYSHDDRYSVAGSALGWRKDVYDGEKSVARLIWFIQIQVSNRHLDKKSDFLCQGFGLVTSTSLTINFHCNLNVFTSVILLMCHKAFFMEINTIIKSPYQYIKKKMQTLLKMFK